MGVQTVENTVEVPQVQTVERTVQVPQVQIEEVVRQVNVPQTVQGAPVYNQSRSAAPAVTTGGVIGGTVVGGTVVGGAVGPTVSYGTGGVVRTASYGATLGGGVIGGGVIGGGVIGGT